MSEDDCSLVPSGHEFGPDVAAIHLSEDHLLVAHAPLGENAVLPASSTLQLSRVAL